MAFIRYRPAAVTTTTSSKATPQSSPRSRQESKRRDLPHTRTSPTTPNNNHTDLFFMKYHPSHHMLLNKSRIINPPLGHNRKSTFKPINPTFPLPSLQPTPLLSVLPTNTLTSQRNLKPFQTKLFQSSSISKSKGMVGMEQERVLIRKQGKGMGWDLLLV